MWAFQSGTHRMATKTNHLQRHVKCPHIDPNDAKHTPGHKMSNKLEEAALIVSPLVWGFCSYGRCGGFTCLCPEASCVIMCTCLDATVNSVCSTFNFYLRGTRNIFYHLIWWRLSEQYHTAGWGQTHTHTHTPRCSHRYRESINRAHRKLYMYFHDH